MKKILITLFVLTFNQGLFSQNYQEKILLKDFVIQIEKKFNVKCFYDESWLEKYQVINSTDKLSIEEVLEDALTDNKILKYFYYKDEYIIFTEIENIDLRRQNINNENQVELRSPLEEDTNVGKVIHQIGIPGLNEKISTISGKVIESISKQPLSGVSIIADEGNIGTSTNSKGDYKIYLTKGYHILTYSYMGMEPTLRKVQLYSSGSLNVSLNQKVNLLEEISIMGEESKKEKQITGYSKLRTLDINEIPSFMGEVDIIKHSLLLPGIQSVGEMDMSFNVRGGKGDQNLILIDGIHTYSHSHFFGLFPGINPYSIDNATLYKASIPVEYGNRLSSVYDIKIKEGSYQSYDFEGGISPVSSNISINGPIIKEKLSLNASYRGTYSNLVLDLIDVKELENSSVSFYDYNLKLSYKANLRNQFSFFFTRSYDDFSFNREMEYQTYNNLFSLNSKNYLKDELVLETVLGLSNYKIDRIEIPSEQYASIKEHSITDIKLNSKLSWGFNEYHKFIGGIELVYHEVNPWNIKPRNSASFVNPLEMNKNKGLELSLFVGDKVNIIKKLSLDLGIRLSTYTYLGENTEFKYNNGIITETNIIDTISYANNEIIDFDWGPEIRISGSYELRKNQNINFSYNRNRQYISILTNTQAITPIGSWQLSNKYIPAQISDQYSVGYKSDFYSKMFSISLEAYYKNIDNLKDFKNGSRVELNPHPETEIVNAEGKAYGFEFMVEKDRGRLSGWISYTYSRTFIKADSKVEDKVINDGNYYDASYDKPHNVSAVINIEPTKRFKISNVVNFNSGSPITSPVSKMYIDNHYFIVYSKRNEFRLPYYLRWDISLSIRGSLKRNKKIDGLLVFSIYNVLGRNNVYSIFYENNQDIINGYKLSIFGEPIPTITYKFKF